MRTHLKTTEILEQFIQEQDLADASLRSYRNALLHVFRYAAGRGWDERNLTRSQIIELKRAHEGDHCSGSSLDLYLTTLRKFYRWAIRKGYISASPMDDIRNPARYKGYKKDPIPMEKITELIASIPQDTTNGPRDLAIILLMLCNGLRSVEITRINVEDLTIEASRQILKIQGKGKKYKDFKIVIEPQVMSAISAYLLQRRDYAPQDPLFIKHHRRNMDKRINTHYISTMIKARLKAIGVDSPRITAHSMRHTAAMNIIKQGGNPYDVKEFLRHSSISTAELYLGKIREEQRMENIQGKQLIKAYDFEQLFTPPTK